MHTLLEKEEKSSNTQEVMSDIRSVEVIWVMIASYCAGNFCSSWAVTCLKLSVLEIVAKHKGFTTIFSQKENS